ncbi:GNAT family N-acetyltransferase [Armatimonas rosea]|uniref:RimJ/RimL family protein N-acetyltransferase n=1 Tax=Armatimonas rosea TaxID=685828 RepID=A0A7W9W4D8_ARMRO|nr:GNAT family N-acetyltransferase [Armatimonas rosea]MBB6048408.1 RimJ/RimL family protein N-acetyltransferase [Armatimonas rosea]
MERLTGDRVCLRGVALTDTDAVFAIWSDPEAMRYWSHPPYTERAQAEAKLTGDLASSAAGSALPWAITLVGDDQLIGMCTLHQIDLSNGRAEVGYLLGRSYWGQGLATEAASLVIDYAFTTLGLRRLEADIDPRNTGSQRLLERLGFERDGYLRERWCVAGEVSDSALYGLLAREWSIK